MVTEQNQDFNTGTLILELCSQHCAALKKIGENTDLGLLLLKISA